MPFAAILREVDQLQSVSMRLERLAEQHAPIAEALLTIAGNVRNTANRIGCAGSGERPEADLKRRNIRPPSVQLLDDGVAASPAPEAALRASVVPKREPTCRG